jgi:hypothetical protein
LKATLKPLRENDMEEYVVTLVHGTWARRAPWTKEDSPLCCYLRETLRDVTFYRFEWSGRNSNSARFKAAEKLQLELTTRLTERPTAKHYIIAHSHGGNVALYALRDPELCQRISGLVCLATPFFHVRQRWLGKLGKRYLRGAAIMAIYSPLYLIKRIALPRYAPVLPSWLDNSIFILMTLLSVILGLFLFSRSEMLGKAIKKNLESPDLERNQLLILRASGDEASGVLIASQFTSWLITRVWLKATSLSVRFDHVLQKHLRNVYQRFRLVLFLALLSFDIYGVVMIRRHFAGWPVTLFNNAILAVGIIISIAVLPEMTLLFFAIPIALVSLPFSPGTLAYFWLEVNAEQSPPGTWTVHTLSMMNKIHQPSGSKGASHESGLDLMHSVYESRETLSIIGSWIQTDPQLR